MGRRAITLIFPYYDNPQMLERQFTHLEGLPADVKGAVNLIVVDDGSPRHPLGVWRHFCEGLASLRVFRITVDVRWNWIAARNLAADQARTDWLLMTDIDHMVPEATFRRIQERKLDELAAYRFSRVDAPALTPYKPHPNSWLMTKKLFDHAGGYDERFSGFYGSDGEFRDRVTAAARKVEILPEVLIRVPREVVPDASTTTYDRKQPMDATGVAVARAKIRADPTPHRLTFPWEEVAL